MNCRHLFLLIVYYTCIESSNVSRHYGSVKAIWSNQLLVSVECCGRGKVWWNGGFIDSKFSLSSHNLIIWSRERTRKVSCCMFYLSALINDEFAFISFHSHPLFCCCASAFLIAVSHQSPTCQVPILCRKCSRLMETTSLLTIYYRRPI